MRVSVIVPTYGWQAHLHHLYRHFDRQTYPDKELLILDDSPEPWEEASRLDDDRLVYLHSPERLAIGTKRNRLVERASGELIAHFDHDDYYAPGYLERMVAALGDGDLVTLGGWFAFDVPSRSFFYWQTGRVLPVHYRLTAEGPRALDLSTADDLSSWARRNVLGYGFSYLYRRSLLSRARFPEDRVHDEDAVFVESILSRDARVGVIDDREGLLLHLTHRGGMSTIYPNHLLPEFMLPVIFGEAPTRYLAQAFGVEFERKGSSAVPAGPGRSRPRPESSVEPVSESDDSAAPVFIGGAARSGTTLLRVMLDSHPRIACGPELKVIPDWLQQWQRDVESFGAYAAENLRMERGIVDDAYRAKLASFLERVRERSGKPRIAEKTPRNVIYFGHIHQLFPDSPLIHVIRDGRDVVASLLGMEWYYPDGRRVPYTKDVEAASRYWAESVSAGLKARRHLGGKVLEVRYESLVEQPEREMRRVLAHLGEPWDDAVLHHDRHPHDLAGETSAGQVSRPVHTASVGRWRSVLSDGDLATIREETGRLLAELGYD